MRYVTEANDPGKISFNAGIVRKKAIAKLTAYLELSNDTELFKALVDAKLKEVLPAEYKKVEADDPKAESRRQALEKAA